MNPRTKLAQTAPVMSHDSLFLILKILSALPEFNIADSMSPLPESKKKPAPEVFSSDKQAQYSMLEIEITQILYAEINLAILRVFFFLFPSCQNHRHS